MVSGLAGLTYEEKCRELGMDSLEKRRWAQDMKQAFRIIRGVDRVEPSSVFGMPEGEGRTRAAARRMLKAGAGTIIFTGASASVKGFAQSSAFAMGKFALRGLAQSMARELAPQNIHVAHVVIDGGIRSAVRPVPADKPDSLLDPDAIAQSYVHLVQQQRSAWTWEIEVRPWVERF